MHDYLGILAPGEPPEAPPDLEAALSDLGWAQVAHRDSLALYVPENCPIRRTACNGIIIGTMFDREGRDAGPILDLGAGSRKADVLTRCFWGSYVGLLRDDGWSALRDPSGGLACYFSRHRGLLYLTSRPRLLTKCRLADPSIDWTQVARSLGHHSLRGSRTAIKGIRELLPGTMLGVGGRRSKVLPVWSAAQHVQAHAPEDSADKLREVLQWTLGAWGRTLRRPLLEISGGLDSAIVAAGIAQTCPGARCITFASAAGDPDELPYARAIADHLGLSLAVVRPDPGAVDLETSLAADLPRPNARAFTQAADALSLEVGKALGVDAFVSGGGGDDVFCYLRSILPAIDRLAVEGPRAMLATARDIAIMNHSTVWQALAMILRRLSAGAPARQQPDGRFLTVDASAAFPDAHRPSASRALPGKAAHIESILTIGNYLEGHARARFAPILSPLLSQPIVESCLAIPTWRWCEGGRNRAAARSAMSGLLPAAVLARRSKGHFDGFCSAVLNANRQRVTAMLAEGQLARNGLIDRSAVLAAMEEPFPPAETVTRLLALVDAEAWVGSQRAWTEACDTGSE